MGYYIQTEANLNKANDIATKHGGRVVSQKEAAVAMQDMQIGVIAVVNNGLFEAAAFCYSQAEFEEFTQPSDRRPRQFVLLPRHLAKELTNYRGA